MSAIAMVPKLRFKDENGRAFQPPKSLTLGELAKFRRGSFPQPYGLAKWYDHINGASFVQVFDVADDFKLKTKTQRYISKAAQEQSVFVKEGSLIITIQGSIGRVAITQYDAYLDRTLLLFESFKEDIDVNYFSQILYLLFDIERRKAPGGIIKTITKEVLTQFKIAICPFPEQQKIANFLTAVDTKISQLTKKHELLTLYKKGVMQKIFNQELRFKDDEGREFPGWKCEKLSKLAKIYDGTHMTPDYKESGVPFYSVEHLTSDNFQNTKYISKEVFEKENMRVRLEKGDILMTRIGDIGTSKYIDWEVNASFYVSLALIKSESISTKYLTHLIRSSFFQKELYQRTIHVAFPKKINLGEIGECLVLIPIAAEQTKIADFLTAIDEKVANAKSLLEAAKEYKQGLLQQMFV